MSSLVYFSDSKSKSPASTATGHNAVGKKKESNPGDKRRRAGMPNTPKAVEAALAASATHAEYHAGRPSAQQITIDSTTVTTPKAAKNSTGRATKDNGMIKNAGKTMFAWAKVGTSRIVTNITVAKPVIFFVSIKYPSLGAFLLIGFY
jgi:hypothetical protein